jgi:hypothetical protein
LPRTQKDGDIDASASEIRRATQAGRRIPDSSWLMYGATATLRPPDLVRFCVTVPMFWPMEVPFMRLINRPFGVKAELSTGRVRSFLAHGA